MSSFLGSITSGRVFWGGCLAVLALPLVLKIRRKIAPFTPEIMAVMTGMGPNAVRWCWRTKVLNRITCTPLQVTLRDVAYRADLFYHGNQQSGQGVTYPTLFLHGDSGGHPFNTLHLADRVLKAKKGPVYSFRVTYRDGQPEPHRALLEMAIGRIESLVKSRGPCRMIGVGYSHGCAELAHRVYVIKDPRIKAIISVAGRFKVTTGPRAPKPDKIPLIKKLEMAMPAMHFPHYQIAAGNDWCTPPEASITEPSERSLCVPDTMHINVVFHPTTLGAFDRFHASATKAARKLDFFVPGS